MLRIIEQGTALITLAQQHNMTLDQLQTALQINQNDIAYRERMFAAELGRRCDRTIARAGPYGRKPAPIT